VLYDAPDGAQSDGERALDGTTYYMRLTQRLVAALQAPTGEGLLYQVDLRLRPSGEAGLLVSSIAAFAQYQRESAWVWEHQALTRARACAGDPAVGAAFEAIRTEVLLREREPAELGREIPRMRERMHEAHPNRSGLFDVKHDRGGMIDVEFAVQYLVLAHAHRFPDLCGNLGNIALLGIAAGHGLVAPELARGGQDAYRELRRLQHALRLQGAQFARVSPGRVEPHARNVRAEKRGGAAVRHGGTSPFRAGTTRFRPWPIGQTWGDGNGSRDL